MAGRSESVLASLEKACSPEWPKGVYFCGAEVFRVGIVVASELPRDRSTVLVRLMAAGPLLPQAIEDLAALPDEAHERVVAEQILLSMQHVLGSEPEPTSEEQEFITMIHTTWAQERKLGRDEGRTEEAARALLTVLRVRGISVPDVVRELILAQNEPARLERWLEKAIVADSVLDVVDEPS